MWLGHLVTLSFHGIVLYSIRYVVVLRLGKSNPPLFGRFYLSEEGIGLEAGFRAPFSG